MPGCLSRHHNRRHLQTIWSQEVQRDRYITQILWQPWPKLDWWYFQRHLLAKEFHCSDSNFFPCIRFQFTVRIAPSNGLAPSRLQPITWTKEVPVHRLHWWFTSLAELELESSGRSRLSIILLVTHWFFLPPGLYQPRHWLCRINVSPMLKDLKFMCHRSKGVIEKGNIP